MNENYLSLIVNVSQASDTFYGVRGHLQHLAIANAGLTLLPSFQLPRSVVSGVHPGGARQRKKLPHIYD